VEAVEAKNEPNNDNNNNSTISDDRTDINSRDEIEIEIDDDIIEAEAAEEVAYIMALSKSNRHYQSSIFHDYDDDAPRDPRQQQQQSSSVKEMKGTVIRIETRSSVMTLLSPNQE